MILFTVKSSYVWVKCLQACVHTLVQKDMCCDLLLKWLYMVSKNYSKSLGLI